MADAPRRNIWDVLKDDVNVDQPKLPTEDQRRFNAAADSDASPARTPQWPARYDNVPTASKHYRAPTDQMDMPPSPENRNGSTDTDDMCSKDVTPKLAKKPGRVTCDICGDQLATRSTLRNHKARRHGEAARFECATCGHRYNNRGEYLDHVDGHTGTKRHKCETCDMAFTHKSSLSAHKKVCKRTNIIPSLNVIRDRLKFNTKKQEVGEQHNNGVYEETHTSFDENSQITEHRTKRFDIPVLEKHEQLLQKQIKSRINTPPKRLKVDSPTKKTRKPRKNNDGKFPGNILNLPPNSEQIEKQSLTEPVNTPINSQRHITNSAAYDNGQNTGFTKLTNKARKLKTSPSIVSPPKRKLKPNNEISCGPVGVDTGTPEQLKIHIMSCSKELSNESNRSCTGRKRKLDVPSPKGIEKAFHHPLERDTKLLESNTSFSSNFSCIRKQTAKTVTRPKYYTQSSVGENAQPELPLDLSRGKTPPSSTDSRPSSNGSVGMLENADEEQPLDLSVKRPSRGQARMDPSSAAAKNIDRSGIVSIGTQADESKVVDARIQNSIFQTFSIQGIHTRKVSPVRPHIRGKPVRKTASAFVMDSNASSVDQQYESLSAGQVNITKKYDSTSPCELLRIGDRTQSSGTHELQTEDCRKQSNGYDHVHKSNNGYTSCEINGTGSPEQGFSKSQNICDALELDRPSSQTVLNVPSIKRSKSVSHEKRSPSKQLNNKRCIPTAHVKPNQVEACSFPDVKQTTAKPDETEQVPKDDALDTYEMPPLLDDTSRILSSSLESVSDILPQMPVLSPHRDALLSPSSQQNKSDNLLTSPPLLTRLSPLPGSRALSYPVSDSETKLVNNAWSPDKELSPVIQSTEPFEGVPKVNASEDSSQSVCVEVSERMPSDNDMSQHTTTSTHSSEVFSFTREYPLELKGTNTRSGRDGDVLPDLIAFEYSPPQVKRYRMDIANTKYYTQVIAGKKEVHNEHTHLQEILIEETKNKNAQESAYPKLQLTDDWKRDQVTYKSNNLRIPKKLIKLPESTPVNFMRGIEKFFPRAESLNKSSSKREKPKSPRAGSTASEGSRKKRTMKSYEFGGKFASFKLMGNNVSKEAFGQTEDNADKFMIKLEKLTHSSIKKALTALVIPGVNHAVPVKVEKPPEPDSIPIGCLPKNNKRLLDIVERAKVSLASKETQASVEDVCTKSQKPQRVSRRNQAPSCKLAGSNYKKSSPKNKQKMASTPIKDNTPIFSSLTGTSPITAACSTGKSPLFVKTGTSPKKSPRRSPRSPRSPRKFSGDRWVFPGKRPARSPSTSSQSGDCSQQMSSLGAGAHSPIDNEPFTARRNLTQIISSTKSPEKSPRSKSPIACGSYQGDGTKSSRAKKNAKHRKSLLAQLANTDGYIADKHQKSENLYLDPSQLNREERALQRAIMKITEMEVKASTCKPVPNKGLQSPKKSSCTRKADELKKKARRNNNPTAMGKMLKQKYEDFRPLILGARTRLQATGRDNVKTIGGFHKDLAYEKALKTDEQRKAFRKPRQNRKSHDPGIPAPLPPNPSTDPSLGGPATTNSMTTLNTSLDSIDQTIEAVIQQFSQGPQQVYTGRRGHPRARGIPRLARTPSARGRGAIARRSHFVGNQYAPQIEIDIADDSMTCARLGDSTLSRVDDDASSLCSSAPGDGTRLSVPLEVKRLNVCRDTGETILHKAARMAYLDIVEWCCKTKYVDVRARDYAGFSALHETCVSENVEIARCLLQYGADVNVASRQDGIRPLHDAIERDNFGLVRLFLSWGADPTLSTYSGRTALKIARTREMRKFLRGYFADLNGSDTDDASVLSWNVVPRFPITEGCTGSSTGEPQSGFDILAGAPDDPTDAHNIVFHTSEDPFINCYLVSLDGYCRPRNYVLLSDLMSRLHKSEKEFRIAYPEILVNRISSSSITGPEASLLRNESTVVTLALVAYDSKVMEVLNIEETLIPDEWDSVTPKERLQLKRLSSESTDTASSPAGSKSTVFPTHSDADVEAISQTASPFRCPSISTVSFREEVTDDDFSRDLDDEDGHFYYGDCKGCSSPELSEAETDELPFNNYPVHSDSYQTSTVADKVLTNTPCAGETKQPIQGNNVYISLLSGQTVVQPSNFPSKIDNSSGSSLAANRPPANNNNLYHTTQRVAPKPIFILSADDHIITSSIVSESANAPQDFIPWEGASIQEMHAENPSPNLTEGVYEDLGNSPMTLTSTGPNSDNETASENDYGLRIAQVCSLSANDAKTVFGSDVEIG